MLIPQPGPDWPARIQAGTSAFTALFAATSLWLLRRYLMTTQATFQTTLRVYEEGARPVLLLVQILEQDSERFAVYRNTGPGLAINISQTNLFTTYADDNVLSPNQETILRIPLRLEVNVIDLRYEALTGKKLCTVSSFHKDGTIFNEYVPDVRIAGEQGISRLRNTCMSLATAAISRKLVASEAMQTIAGVPA